MDEPTTYLSLFSGIGGLDLAVESLWPGIRCVGQIESDPACLRVLERHWPTVRRWSNIHGFSLDSYLASDTDSGGQQSVGTQAIGEESRKPHGNDPIGLGNQSLGVVALPDIIIGGFPCQPVSPAGKLKAQHDDRWLWPEFARVVDEFHPRHVFIENVRGLFTAGVDPRSGEKEKGRAFAEVISDLAAMWYDARWLCIRAADAGAPHKRDRVFILATEIRQGEAGR